MNFMLRFLLNLSIIPLPAEELYEICAVFLTEFVYYSLTSRRIKMNFMLRFLLNLSIAPLPDEELKKLYVVFHK